MKKSDRQLLQNRLDASIWRAGIRSEAYAAPIVMLLSLDDRTPDRHLARELLEYDR